jgi:hypothetical protein
MPIHAEGGRPISFYRQASAELRRIVKRKVTTTDPLWPGSAPAGKCQFPDGVNGWLMGSFDDRFRPISDHRSAVANQPEAELGATSDVKQKAALLRDRLQDPPRYVSFFNVVMAFA